MTFGSIFLKKYETLGIDLKQQPIALLYGTNKNKTNKSATRFDVTGAIDHMNPLLCPKGAMGMLFLHDYWVKGRCGVPDFENFRQEMTRAVFGARQSADPTAQLNYKKDQHPAITRLYEHFGVVPK